ncbi:uncharacterized protein GGS22DRAFT_180925 [Annulohypoxylon maeteangense]|uniref:uncharacterized protein n=1 Tax=Annulohypoxylon maeteangense TaxID=1927788 RepID=UPI0020089EEA|nr:uncharacterized protein GGS22DRAFT_180925 [Annulohypoxylon maeteangense]KAI0882826.1 hypothetical protein GGS22DRAFT_180925 [Annulohypoxylon maeteangense]
MFSRWSSLSSTNRHGESSNRQKEERRHRSKHHDSTQKKRRRIYLVDLDDSTTNRGVLNISIKESWGLDHVADTLKRQYLDKGLDKGGRTQKEAEIQFFLNGKRLNETKIPDEASSLQYRILEEGDNGALRVSWKAGKAKLRKHQIETITKEIEAGRSIGSLRETIANLIRPASESKGHPVGNANQIVIKAVGGLREGSLQGNSWEARKVQRWLCRHLVIDLVSADSYFVLRGFNEEYICQKPYCTPHGYADTQKIKQWLRDKVMSPICPRISRHRPIDVEDIKFSYRGKPVKRRNHIRPGETIDFDVPRVVEDKFVAAEAWLVPLTDTCIVCSDDKRVSEMPNRRKITASCEHDSTICKECVGAWIASSMDTVTWDRLKCPECPQLLKYENVRAFATKDVFERYDNLAVKAFLSNLHDFFWCLNPRCNSGQIYPTGCEKGKCDACKHSICVRHNVPWHRGETCEDYERRTRKQRKNDKASEKHVKEITKPCPGCNRNVHKYTGCDHVTCICGHEWCWLCFGQYYRDEQDFLQCHHTQECRYHDNPPNYEGGRAFMPFLNMAHPPAPPPLFPPRRAQERRPPPPVPVPVPGNIPLRPRPNALDGEFAEIFRRHMGRNPWNPFDPNININLVRPHAHDPVGPDFFEDAMFFNLGHLMRRAGRERLVRE